MAIPASSYPSSHKKRKRDDGNSSSEETISAPREIHLSPEKILDLLFMLMKNYPHYRQPSNYETTCSGCYRKFTLNGLSRPGIVECSVCGYHNILEPAPSGYTFIRYTRCSHVDIVEDCKTPGSCRICGNTSSESSVELSFRKPQMKRITDERRAILSEMKRHPHRVVPDLFECRCVWEGCLKYFTPYNCDDGSAQCSNCFKQVPIEFGEPGYTWIFYNRCNHVHSVRANDIPRNCPTCGIESTPRPSGVAAPKRKQQIELPSV